MSENELTARQARFVEEYLVDLNATQAAIRAGYSERTAESQGSRLLRNVKVAAVLDARREARVERTKVDQEYVIETLQEVVERCMQREPVMVRRGRNVVHLVDDEGRHVWRFDARNAVAALNLLAKHTGGFTDRHEVTGKDGGPIQVEEMTDEEVRTRATHLRNRLLAMPGMS